MDSQNCTFSGHINTGGSGRLVKRIMTKEYDDEGRVVKVITTEEYVYTPNYYYFPYNTNTVSVTA